MRRTIHDPGKLLHLLDTDLHEVPGVFSGGLQRSGTVVHFFVEVVAGDGVIFDAGETANAARGKVGADIVVIEIETDIAVKIAVAPSAGVTFVLAPDLPRGFEITPKGGDAVFAEHRSEDAVARSRPRVEQAVSVDDKPADAGFLEMLL